MKICLPLELKKLYSNLRNNWLFENQNHRLLVTPTASREKRGTPWRSHFVLESITQNKIQSQTVPP